MEPQAAEEAQFQELSRLYAEFRGNLSSGSLANIHNLSPRDLLTYNIRKSDSTAYVIACIRGRSRVERSSLPDSLVPLSRRYPYILK